MNKFFSVIFLATLAFSSQAVTIQDTADASNVTTIDGITIVKINGATFSVAAVPTTVNQFENSTSTDTHAELKGKLPLGELATRSEVEAVIKSYFESSAFDSASIAVRSLIVGTKKSWAVWCSNPWLLGCLEWHGLGGTWVEFEANGRNRSGGMTGYQRTIWMVRKFSQLQ